MNAGFLDQYGLWIFSAILALAMCADSLGRFMTPGDWCVTVYVCIGVLLFAMADYDTAPGMPFRQRAVVFALVVVFWPILVTVHLMHWD